MKGKIYWLFAFLVCLEVSVKAQPIGSAAKGYTDIVIKNDKVWALSNSGALHLYDANTGAGIDTTALTGSKISAITVDKTGSIIVVDATNKISQLDEHALALKEIAHPTATVYGMVYDTHNNCYLITQQGISDAKGDIFYLPDASFHLNHQVRGWLKPSAIFIDHYNNIWIGGAHGEWGGDLYIFNTEKKEFIKPEMNSFRIELWPVKSIFGQGDHIYVSFGLQHMMTGGCITVFNDFSCKPVIESEAHWEEVKGQPFVFGGKTMSAYKEMVDGEYIGPALYNKADSCIYFYSQHGIFKGNPSNDLSKVEAWTKVSVPALHWVYGQRDAVGSPMNVLKMAFNKHGDLFLATQNDGLVMIAADKLRVMK